MKAVLITATLLTLFAICCPLVTLDIPYEPEKTDDAQKVEKVEGDNEWTDTEKNVQNTEFTVNVLLGDETVTMDLEEYLIGVVAGEMPVSFEEEALKAQAVAARTYTLYKLWVEPSVKHDADVCTDPNCCKAYSAEAELREKWGDDFEKNMTKIEMAVWNTQGVYMVYESEPILAVFHSSSSGATENSGNVWNRDLPYLVSVESPESGDEINNYVTTTEISYSEFKSIFTEEYPDAKFTEETEEWVKNIEYSESGRINSVVIGETEISGTELRSLYKLRSTAVSIAMGANGVVFTVTGYGHGVGMSQYGANCLAQQGKSWREILQWYYTGVDFADMIGNV